MNKISGYYDKKYFAWQSSVGEFGGWANLCKFNNYIADEDDVLDFGCGGGYLLKNLKCRKKFGIEINASAIEVARNNGVETYESVDDVPDESVDVIISNNALEHTTSPLEELIRLKSKLRINGSIIFVVPCESIFCRYESKDIHQHLYSWSPMCIGNLFKAAGYEVVESKVYLHKWPPKYRIIAKIGGRRLFESACRIYGMIDRKWSQVRVVGKRRN